MTLNCNGTLIDLTQPKVMGILNFTSDSFYDGGKYQSDKEILLQTEKMLTEGADFIDVGVYSSRPNASIVTERDEVQNMQTVLQLLTKEFPEAIYSIDTFRSEVARIALENGGALINDISAGSLDQKMMDVVALYKVPYIMMHTRGTPQTMTRLTEYDNLVADILFYFSEKIAQARSKGICDLIVDVGFGFAKTTEQNYELLQKLDVFQSLGLPQLVGVSRKRMIYTTLNTTADKALNGTTALNAIALQKGANILRVHDVLEAKQTIQLIEKLNQS